MDFKKIKEFVLSFYTKDFTFSYAKSDLTQIRRLLIFLSVSIF